MSLWPYFITSSFYALLLAKQCALECSPSQSGVWEFHWSKWSGIAHHSSIRSNHQHLYFLRDPGDANGNLLTNRRVTTLQDIFFANKTIICFLCAEFSQNRSQGHQAHRVNWKAASSGLPLTDMCSCPWHPFRQGPFRQCIRLHPIKSLLNANIQEALSTSSRTS